MRFFVDVQGTLIDDEKRLPIDGSIEFIDALNKKKIPYVVITNNTKLPSSKFLAYLNSLGFQIDLNHYIDPLEVLQSVLREKEVAAYGTEGFLETLQDLGYRLESKRPQAVVLSVKEDYSFDEFAAINEFILSGAKLYGMHQTSLYAKGKKRYPGVGALLAMFEFACQVQSIVVGKPSKLFFEKALAKIGGNFDDVTIISDDVIGDLVGAKKLGMKSAFVLSGKFKSAKEILPKLSSQPDMVCKDIKECAKRLGVL